MMLADDGRGFDSPRRRSRGGSMKKSSQPAVSWRFMDKLRKHPGPSSAHLLMPNDLYTPRNSGRHIIRLVAVLSIVLGTMLVATIYRSDLQHGGRSAVAFLKSTSIAQPQQGPSQGKTKTKADFADLRQFVHKDCPLKSYLSLNRTSWDYLGVLTNRSLSSSVIREGNLERLHNAMVTAEREKRPLRIGILGGSFSAGGQVADQKDAYTNTLGRLLMEKNIAPKVEIINMAQGGAGFMLPLFCTDKVYSMVADDPTVPPDVWVVEFAENFDSTLEQYEALLAMLLWDKERFGRPAVVTGMVAKNFCWEPDGYIRQTQCGVFRTHEWIKTAAAAMDLPLVSFLHGVASVLGVRPDDLIANSSCLEPTGGPRQLLTMEDYKNQLYADCGQNQHFNEYGHHMFAEYLTTIFVRAKEYNPQSRLASAKLATDELPVLPSKSMEILSKVSSISTEHTLTCNLTLTQGKAIDLVPSAMQNYTLWVEKVKAGNQIYGGRMRSDRKQTWVPQVENATIDFPFQMKPGMSTLCVLMYGANGMWLEASFPDLLQEEVTVIDEEDKLGEVDDKAVQGWGGSEASQRGEHESASTMRRRKPHTALRDTKCMYRGGVDWTIYSVYKIDCGCAVPQGLTDGKTHTIRFKSNTGLIQIAGVVLW